MLTTRRDFLKASLGASTLVSLGFPVPAVLGRNVLAKESRREERETVLVVVQLAGGNDGLNTVVPFEDDHYARNRRTLRLMGNQIHKIDSSLGFHPQLESFRRLYEDGHLSIIQGVGYPKPSGDHGVAMRDWQTACPHETGCQTGWLGRVVDDCGVPAVFVGEIQRSFSLNARRAIVPSIRSLQDLVLPDPGECGGGEEFLRTLEELVGIPPAGEKNELLDFLKRNTLEMASAAKKVGEILRDSPKTSDYPSFQLARMLKTIAQLIRADLGIRIYLTELGGAEPGGFDNHANQRDNHAALLRQLGESVAAFVNDLKRAGLLDRMLLMTFSEFGRTLTENGRRGTDHGSAAPLFLAGGGLRGGLVGTHPSLVELENGGPKFHTDFRRVYATALESWLGFESRAVLRKKFEPLDVFQKVRHF